MHQIVSVRTLRIMIITAALALFITGCNGLPQPGIKETPVPQEAVRLPEEESAGKGNPAAEFCIAGGYRSEIRQAEDGSQYGVCIFPNGSDCEEWSYYNGKCSQLIDVPTGENKAVEAAKIKLAEELSIAAGEISLFSLKAIMWPDSCIGIPTEGETCLAVETPGFRVIFMVGEKPYNYHTDLTEANIRREIIGGHP